MGFCSAALELMGWEPFSEEQTRLLQQHPKAVMIFPHTSYYEFFLYLFYRGHSPLLQRRCKILVAPVHTDRFQFLLKHIGSIPATRQEERNGGATERIKTHLAQLDEWLLVMSPKGSMSNKHPWRRGFYAIAKDLGVPIIPAGFDFEKKRFVIKPAFWVKDLTFAEACDTGKAALYDIIPCHPDKSEFPISPLYDPSKLGLMTAGRWVIFWLLFLAGVVGLGAAVYYFLKWKRGRKEGGEMS